LTSASPVSTSSPRWFVQTVRSRIRLRSRMTSTTSARAVMTSPKSTGLRNLSSCEKKIAVGSVQAIHAMLSIDASLHPAERETARDVVADEPDHECAGDQRQHAG